MMTEMVFAVVFLVLALLLFQQSMELSFILETGVIGAGFFPRLLTIILIVLTGFYLLNLILKRNKGNGKESLQKQVIWKQVYLAGAVVLVVFLGEILGLLVTIGLFLLVTLVIIEKLTLIKSAVISLSAVICIYLIFDVWLRMPMPMGIFG
jgi:hypothetical protein